MLGHASGLPPGISEGPYLAPSSPPDTPEPTYRIPFLCSSAVLLVVSWYSEFPPSMMISPFSSSGTNLLMKSSTAWPAESRQHSTYASAGRKCPYYSTSSYKNITAAIWAFTPKFTTKFLILFHALDCNVVTFLL